MPSGTAISVRDVSHHYGEHQALNELSFDVQTSEIFGLLGPNGGGKTTLFRLLSTLLSLQSGEISILSHNLAQEPAFIRRLIGVTFQSPSLDDRLTVQENLVHQAHLYGLNGSEMRERISTLVGRLGLPDRTGDRVSSLSGGLKRRAEIAKGLLHQPQVLLLDEPSTGLDPGARHDLWQYLGKLRDEQGVTVLVTTHLMEEAERCDRLGILDHGKLVALGTPDELRATVGGDCITIESDKPQELAQRIQEKFQIEPQLVDGTLRIERENGHDFLRDVVDAFKSDLTSVSYGRPTLEDVFIDRTGHRFWEAEQEA